MSIYNNTWAADELVTASKLNGMVADANNATDEIHPQYSEFYSGIPYICGTLQQAASLRYNFSGQSYYLTVGGTVNAVAWTAGSGIVPIMQAGFSHAIKKKSTGFTKLNLSFLYDKNNNTNDYTVSYLFVVSGVIVGTITTRSCTTSPQTETVQWTISSYSVTDILEVQVYVTASTVNDPGGMGAATAGRFYNAHVYLS